jgi:hypothetical protein
MLNPTFFFPLCVFAWSSLSIYWLGELELNENKIKPKFSLLGRLRCRGQAGSCRGPARPCPCAPGPPGSAPWRSQPPACSSRRSCRAHVIHIRGKRLSLSPLLIPRPLSRSTPRKKKSCCRLGARTELIGVRRGEPPSLPLPLSLPFFSVAARWPRPPPLARAARPLVVARRLVCAPCLRPRHGPVWRARSRSAPAWMPFPRRAPGSPDPPSLLAARHGRPGVVRARPSPLPPLLAAMAPAPPGSAASSRSAARALAVACSRSAPGSPVPSSPSPRPAAWSSAGVPLERGRSSAGAAVATPRGAPSRPRLARGHGVRDVARGLGAARPTRVQGALHAVRGSRPRHGSRPGRPPDPRPPLPARPWRGSQRAARLLATTMHGLLAVRLRCRSRWPRASQLPARRGPLLLGASVARSSASAWLSVARG